MMPEHTAGNRTDKLLPLRKLHSIGKGMVNEKNCILEGNGFMEKKRLVNRNEKC